MPNPVARVFQGAIVVMVFPAGSFRADDYVLRVGRWKPGGKQFYCSEFLPASELDDAATAIELAIAEIERLKRESRTRRKRRV